MTKGDQTLQHNNKERPGANRSNSNGGYNGGSTGSSPSSVSVTPAEENNSIEGIPIIALCHSVIMADFLMPETQQTISYFSYPLFLLSKFLVEL